MLGIYWNIHIKGYFDHGGLLKIEFHIMLFAFMSLLGLGAYFYNIFLHKVSSVI